MKSIRKIFLAFGLSLLFAGQGFAQQANDDVIFSALKKEIAREMEGLKLPGYTTPYHISYLLKDTEFASVSANLGVIVSDRYVPRDRVVGGAIYTGDYELNNDGGYKVPFGYNRTVIDNDETQIRRDLWQISDVLYKNAASEYQNKKAALKRQNITSPQPDMLRTTPVEMIDDSAAGLNADRENMRRMAKELSAVFLDYPELYNSIVMITAMQHTTYLVNSEGTTLKQPITMYAVSAMVSTDMPEGTEVSDTLVEIFPSSGDVLPTAELKAKIDGFAREMSDMRSAPLADEYYFGPVLFEGSAVVNIFTSAFLSQNTLLGYRKPVDAQTAQMTLANRVGKRVVDARFTVKNLTDLEEYDGKKLIGAYDVDIEGVIPPSSVTLIENGLFKRTLNSRIPTDISNESTGSLRFGIGAGPSAMTVSPGVLHISATGTEKMDKLRKKLIKGAVEEGNDYAYIVRKMDSNPKVYHLNLKTGKETLVRNAAVSGVVLNKLRRVLGISDKEQVVNFQINGSIPISVICPTAILVEDVEITPRETKKEQLFFTTKPLNR